MNFASYQESSGSPGLILLFVTVSVFAMWAQVPLNAKL